MSHKLVNTMKMWKGIGNTTTLLFSLNVIKEYMVVVPEVKYSGIKIVPRSDLQVRAPSGITTNKEIKKEEYTPKVSKSIFQTPCIFSLVVILIFSVLK